jgi:hypothetical protein
MTNESTPILPSITFAITALVVFGIIIKYNVSAARASKRLKQALAQAGVADKYPKNYPYSWRFAFHPDSIRDTTDASAVRDAKEEVIAWGTKLAPTLFRAMLIAVSGAVLGAALGILEFYLKRTK